MIHVKEFSEDKYVFFTTKNGTVKRMNFMALKTARKAGIQVIGIEDGDEVVKVSLTDGDDNIIIATKKGQAVCFNENEVRAMGRSAYGVRGIRLKDDDYVISATREREGAYILTVTENGYGKLTEAAGFTQHHRGGYGMIGHRLTDKTGDLVGIKSVMLEDDVFLMTSEGVLIRISCETVRICGRSSQGVRLIRVGDDVKVIAVARTDKEEDDDFDGAEGEEGADELTNEEETGAQATEAQPDEEN